MKKIFFSVIMLSIISLLLTGCFQSTPDPVQVILKKGGIALKFDFATLSQTITSVKVIATHPTYGTRNTDLTINDTVANGTLSDLEEGTWHLRVEVYDELSTLIYSGESDINVVAGTTIKCEFVFEPTIEPDTTGNLDIVVIIPSTISQSVDQIVKGTMMGNYYIMDKNKKTVGVYDPFSYAQLNEYTLPDFPSAIAINSDESGLYVGFASGNLGYVNLSTGSFQVITTNLDKIEDLAYVNTDYMVVKSSCDMFTIFYSVNLYTKTIQTSTNSTFNGTTSKMVYNFISQKLYFTVVDSATSAVTLYSLGYTSTGNFGTFYSVAGETGEIGDTLRLIQNSSKIVTSSGNIYSCDSNDPNDLIYDSNLGYAYWDLQIETLNSRLYILNRYDEASYNPTDVTLIGLDQNTLGLIETYSLENCPKYVFTDFASSFTLLIEKEGAWYFRQIKLN